MLKLGMSVNLGWIVKEACVHLIGTSSAEYRIMSPEIVELGMASLIDSKRDLLVQRIKDIDFKLLTGERFRLEKAGARQIAVNVLHQLTVDSVRPWSISPFRDGYATFYGRLASSEDLCTEYTIAKHCPRPEDFAHIDKQCRAAMKEQMVHMAKVAGPLLQDVTKLGGTHDYGQNLLCMGIEDHELPWKSQD